MIESETWVTAQQAVLGSMLIDERCVPQVMRDTTEEDFSPSLRRIYQAIRGLFENNKTIDPVTVLDALGREYQSTILQLMEITPTAANCEHYTAITKEQARIYRIRDLAGQMMDTEDPDKLRELLEAANGSVAQKSSVKVCTMADLMRSFMDRHSKEHPAYLRWPFEKLNKILFTEPGDFLIIGGEPSSGKTAWALQCAWSFSAGQKVGIFTLETNPEKIMDRLMASELELDMNRLKNNQISDQDWTRICSRAPGIADRGLEIIPASGFTVGDIRAYTVMHGYQIIVVDYLQLIASTGGTRAEMVANISMGLHTLAQSLGVTVIALSQLTVDNMTSKAPGLQALRESKQIGQDADVVMMITDRSKDGPEGQETKIPGGRWLRVVKNKEGTLGRVKAVLDGPHQVFYAGDSVPAAEQMKMPPDSEPVPWSE